MKKTLLLCAALMLTIFRLVHAQSAAQTIQFPDDFIYPASEIPAGYILKPIDDEARSMGFTANPGFMDNPSFVLGIYDNMNQQAVDKVFVGMYQPKEDPDFETGYYVIAFKSVAFLNQEKPKFRKYSGARYFTKDRYLVQVWGDAGSFADAVKHMAEYFKTKLDLNEFVPPKDEAAATKATNAVTPAQ